MALTKNLERTGRAGATALADLHELVKSMQTAEPRVCAVCGIVLANPRNEVCGPCWRLCQVYERTPVLDIAALVAFVDDTEAPALFLCRADVPHPDPLIAGRRDCGGCPVIDPEQIEAEQAIRDESALEQIADAKREYKFGKSL